MSDPSTTRTLVSVSNALNLNVGHLASLSRGVSCICLPFHLGILGMLASGAHGGEQIPK